MPTHLRHRRFPVTAAIGIAFPQRVLAPQPAARRSDADCLSSRLSQGVSHQLRSVPLTRRRNGAAGTVDGGLTKGGWDKLVED
jgi:hypothetical protein